jgi:DNA replication protein DnaC
MPLTLVSLLEWIPPKFINEGLGTFKTPTPALRKALKAAKAWRADALENLREEHVGVFLTGPAGVGKSHIAWSLAYDLASAGISVGVISITRYLAATLASFGGGRAAPAPLSVRDWRGRPFDIILLDDIGAEKPADWIPDRLGAFFDDASLRQIPFIATSNLDYDELKECYGERITDRLVELTDKIAVEGESWRVRKHRERRELRGGTDDE